MRYKYVAYYKGHRLELEMIIVLEQQSVVVQSRYLLLLVNVQNIIPGSDRKLVVVRCVSPDLCAAFEALKRCCGSEPFGDPGNPVVKQRGSEVCTFASRFPGGHPKGEERKEA
jgi:hypothetical protein